MDKKKIAQKNLCRVDFAVDAARNIDAVFAIEWDVDGSWWDNRRLLADRYCDLRQNVLNVLKLGDQHLAFDEVIRGLRVVKKTQDALAGRRNPREFGKKWLSAYQAELLTLLKDWRKMKMDLAFTHTNSDQIEGQRKSFGDLRSRTPWQLEQIHFA